ncbi:hypothetical protein B0H10DRAFT_1941483 [Mycena sp. CBHHK59/15]|nr:hypothetical protein B0H10DRAFT_1941483 [Mycena sp. CBHHK59/15]
MLSYYDRKKSQNLLAQFQKKSYAGSFRESWITSRKRKAEGDRTAAKAPRKLKVEEEEENEDEDDAEISPRPRHRIVAKGSNVPEHANTFKALTERYQCLPSYCRISCPTAFPHRRIFPASPTSCCNLGPLFRNGYSTPQTVQIKKKALHVSTASVNGSAAEVTVRDGCRLETPTTVQEDADQLFLVIDLLQKISSHPYGKRGGSLLLPLVLWYHYIEGERDCDWMVVSVPDSKFVAPDYGTTIKEKSSLQKERGTKEFLQNSFWRNSLLFLEDLLR